MPKGLMDAEQWPALGWLLIEGKMQHRDDWKLFCYVFSVARVDVKWKGRFFTRKT